MGYARLAGCLLLLSAGCGDPATNSDMPAPGGSAGEAAGGSGHGGSGQGGSGQGGSTAGSTVTGGTAGQSADAGARDDAGSGGSPDVGDCPPWPRDRLMPTIGPLFYGPDPGPCTETSIMSSSQTVGTYAFDDAGRVLNVTFPTSLRSYSYQDDALSRVTYTAPSKPDSVITYVWSATSVTETLTGTGETVREYMLNESGYPTELWVTDPDLGERRRSTIYRYADCRLTHKEVVYSDGKPDPLQTADYAYDDAGHLIARTSTDGTKLEFDYSCW